MAVKLFEMKRLSPAQAALLAGIDLSALALDRTTLSSRAVAERYDLDRKSAEKCDSIRFLNKCPCGGRL